MRSIQLPFAVLMVSNLVAADFSGTWIGTWEHQGESQKACLYLLQGDIGVHGQIAYRHDTKVSLIDARLPLGDTVEFAIADDIQGNVNFRLKASATTSAETVLVGAATKIDGQAESIKFRKYIVPYVYYRYGAGLVEPVVIHSTMPEYTAQGRAAKLQGAVTLLVSIESSGTVGSDVRVLRGLGLGLDEEAIKCVKRWQFTPPRYDCNVIPVHIKVNVTFRLP